MNTIKTLLCVVIATALFKNVSGQQPYLLVDSTNQWYEYGQFGGYYPYPPQHRHVYYFFRGDTVINGISYKQLFANQRDTSYTNGGGISYLQNSYHYVAAFRQEALKVYFVMKYSPTEKLYCDFDISVGDTLNYYYNYSRNTVDSVSTIPFGNGTRKRYHMNNGDFFYDGIGCDHGLFHDWSIGIEGGVYLVCFEQAGIEQYVNSFGSLTPCRLSGQPIGPCSAFFELQTDTVVPNRFHTVNLSTGASALRYRWTWGVGSVVDTVASPSHTYSSLGNYTNISLTIGDSTGCTDTYNGSFSLATGVMISGAIMTENGVPVSNAKVTLTGDTTIVRYTYGDGTYNFPVQRGGNYIITPSKNSGPTTNNGVTSLDVLRIRQHILNIRPLPSPYKIIAADTDSSNSVTSVDLLLTRALILQVTTTFPNGRLWTFVPSDYVFADPLNPFPAPTSRTHVNVQQTINNQNFIGIKLGDVNNSWDANIW